MRAVDAGRSGCTVRPASEERIMFRVIALISAMSLILCMAVVDPSVHADDKGKDQKTTRNFEVRMKSNQFDQKDITVSVGDTVRWVNEDDGKHSVTMDDGSPLPIKEMVQDGGTFSNRVAFDKEGVLKYHCKFHSATMKGTVTVMK
jgi:plastocyanin